MTGAKNISATPELDTVLEEGVSENLRLTATDSIGAYLKGLFRLIAPLWTGKDRFIAWALLLGIVALELFGAGVTAAISFYAADQIDALKAKAFEQWVDIVLVILALSFINVALVAAGIKLLGVLRIYCRRDITRRMMKGYLQSNVFNLFQLKDYGADNVDQRIGQDIDIMCEETLELANYFISAVFTLIAALGVLWVISGTLEFTVWGVDLAIAGYLVWFALIYSVISVWAVHMVGRPLIKLNNIRQSVNANYRYQLVHLREHSESVALLGGGDNEYQGMQSRFRSIWHNTRKVIYKEAAIMGLRVVLDRSSWFIIILVSLPAYFSGQMTLGAILQAELAFGRVVDQLTWFNQYYTKLAKWKASVDRVMVVEQAFKAAEDEIENCAFKIQNHQESCLKLHNLSVSLPDGRALVEHANVEIAKGKNTLITGTSGAGKSTLFRVISGLWIWGEGDIYYPNESLMFIPQRPYLPLLSLREVLCYPSSVYPPSAESFSDEQIIEAMQRCDFGKFADRLDAEENWDVVFSGGEKQRIAFVRALLNKPEWLLMDEATSALDRKTQAIVYGAVKDYLPSATVISIAHRPSLRCFHDQQLCVNGIDKTVVLSQIEQDKDGLV